MSLKLYVCEETSDCIPGCTSWDTTSLGDLMRQIVALVVHLGDLMLSVAFAGDGNPLGLIPM